MSRLEIDEDGSRLWYNDQGYYHREDGPAVECVNGTKQWFKNGKFHRIGGPAIEWHFGEKEYFLNDKLYTKKEYNKKSLKFPK